MGYLDILHALITATAICATITILLTGSIDVFHLWERGGWVLMVVGFIVGILDTMLDN